MQTGKVIDDYGNSIVEKMRDIAEKALYFSDCTQVPTSLWVEARICYAKQMVFERKWQKQLKFLETFVT